jgi:hypothetical protein
MQGLHLAWGSDVATWCIFCGKNGMHKVPNTHILWRRSSQNITPDKSRQIAERKLMSECEFLNWTYTYFSSEKDIWEVNRALFRRNRQTLWGGCAIYSQTSAFQPESAKQVNNC